MAPEMFGGPCRMGRYRGRHEHVHDSYVDEESKEQIERVTSRSKLNRGKAPLDALDPRCASLRTSVALTRATDCEFGLTESSGAEWTM
jgi:hypothetical protein